MEKQRTKIADTAGKPVRFENCELINSTFTNCNLSNVQLIDCEMNGMKINGILIEDLMKEYRKSTKVYFKSIPKPILILGYFLVGAMIAMVLLSIVVNSIH